MFKSVVYQGNCSLGEAEIYPQNPTNDTTWNKEVLRISRFSLPSDRCPPVAILHTISTAGVCFRLESNSLDNSPMSLLHLHATCFRENKTAVISLGEMEIHLVAMTSRKNPKNISCFWGYNIVTGLYDSCLTMLNLRCLAIVFDLDETLIVANTMRSFEDRIDCLERKINSEPDPQRVAGLLAEVKRYQDDKSILKQYVEIDQVFDSNGKVYEAQSEIVPPLSDSQSSITRPLIRLREKNIILTRVNPAIRDTSVLVRLRPAWEELRRYLTAKGRKRFEVFVCTMAERDYALEMWRLLDPESNLINNTQLLDRVVCVKSGVKKSLLNVFQNAICHPRMALIIDDRLNVWDDADQPRVHVVPAFMPYYAPFAETNSTTVPVFCVARNVACDIRGCFFKDFDDGLLPHFSDVFYEDSMIGFSSAPDVAKYLISEDENVSINGNKDTLCISGMSNIEVSRRSKEANNAQALPLVTGNFDPRLVSTTSLTMVSQVAVPNPITALPLQNNKYMQITAVNPMGYSGLPEHSVQSSPAREEGEVPESELDPDTRRRLLILQHGQDVRDHTSIDSPLRVGSPLQGPVPPRSNGNWFPMNEDASPRQLNILPKEYPLEPESIHFDKKRSNHPPFFHGMENSSHADRGFHENQRFPKKVYRGDNRFRVNQSSQVYYDSFPGEETSSRLPHNSRDTSFESRRVIKYADTSVGVLEEITSKCGVKLEFRIDLVDSTELQFSVKVMFDGEKIGEGIGRTRKKAQHQAAERSLWILANNYLSEVAPEPNNMRGDENFHHKENGFSDYLTSLGYPSNQKGDMFPVECTPELSQSVDYRLPPNTSLSGLKELCTVEGFDLVFQPRPSLSTDPYNEGEVHLQAEINGQILGRGIGMTWEEAKQQAAEEAFINLKTTLFQIPQKHVPSPRSFQTTSNKRLRAEFSRSFPRAYSSRYPKNETFVP